MKSYIPNRFPWSVNPMAVCPSSVARVMYSLVVANPSSMELCEWLWREQKSWGEIRVFMW